MFGWRFERSLTRAIRLDEERQAVTFRPSVQCCHLTGQGRCDPRNVFPIWPSDQRHPAGERLSQEFRFRRIHCRRLFIRFSIRFLFRFPIRLFIRFRFGRPDDVPVGVFCLAGGQVGGGRDQRRSGLRAARKTADVLPPPP